jgi:hypothetical protein
MGMVDSVIEAAHLGLGTTTATHGSVTSNADSATPLACSGTIDSTSSHGVGTLGLSHIARDVGDLQPEQVLTVTYCFELLPRSASAA